jgi:hypothetical protein
LKLITDVLQAALMAPANRGYGGKARDGVQVCLACTREKALEAARSFIGKVTEREFPCRRSIRLVYTTACGYNSPARLA